LRNPLIHELGADKITSARKDRDSEPLVKKWGKISSEYHDIDYLDNLNNWNDDWPVLYEEDLNNKNRIVICDAALYWAVKHLVRTVVSESNL